MKILTIATHSEGYFPLLEKTARLWGYDLHVLGWNREWQGLAWKLTLYHEALSCFPADEPVICVDGYDVVVTGPAEEAKSRFLASGQRLWFSGQRYWPNQPWMQRITDRLMTNSHRTALVRTHDVQGYHRPCTGLFVGYAGDLHRLFGELTELEAAEPVGNDQILLNIYHLRYPGAIGVDEQCTVFQNLWRTRNGLYSQISPTDPSSEVEIVTDADTGRRRVRNKRFQSTPCFIHGPFNLNMDPLLEELDLTPEKTGNRNANYWNYSMMFYITRGIRFYGPAIGVVVAGVALVLALVVKVFG